MSALLACARWQCKLQIFVGNSLIKFFVLVFAKHKIGHAFARAKLLTNIVHRHVVRNNWNLPRNVTLFHACSAESAVTRQQNNWDNPLLESSIRDETYNLYYGKKNLDVHLDATYTSYFNNNYKFLELIINMDYWVERTKCIKYTLWGNQCRNCKSY